MTDKEEAGQMYPPAPPGVPPIYPTDAAPPPYTQQPGVGSAPVQPIINIIQTAEFSDQPQLVYCPKCKVQVTTTVTHDSSGGTFIVCFACCLFGCGVCSLIPFCIDSMKATHHFCPQCQSPLGEKKFLM